MKRLLFGLFLVALPALLMPQIVLAQGNGEHVLGKVHSVDEASLSVATQDGKRLTVGLDAKTRFEKSGEPATAKDLKIGERVVIHARREGSQLIAETVKFGKQSNPAAHR
jgi:hypothetical protein